MATRQPEYVVDADYSDDDDGFDGPSDPPEVIARRQVRIWLALWLPGSRVRGVLALPILRGVLLTTTLPAQLKCLNLKQ